jgi:hypothetical protein
VTEARHNAELDAELPEEVLATPQTASTVSDELTEAQALAVERQGAEMVDEILAAQAQARRRAAIERQLERAQRFSQDPDLRNANAARRLETALARFASWGVDINDEVTLNKLLELYLRANGWNRCSDNPALVIHSRAAAGELWTLLRYSRRGDPNVARVRFLPESRTARTPDIEVQYRDGSSERVEVRTLTQSGVVDESGNVIRHEPGTVPGRRQLRLHDQSIRNKIFRGQLSEAHPGAIVFHAPLEDINEHWLSTWHALLRDINEAERIPSYVRRIEVTTGQQGLIVFEPPDWLGRIVRENRARR